MARPLYDSGHISWVGLGMGERPVRIAALSRPCPRPRSRKIWAGKQVGVVVLRSRQKGSRCDRNMVFY